jgi:hypothetical protein
MTRVSLRELLVEGSSGVVAPGARATDIIHELGEPEDRSQISPEILRYGRLELTFVDGRAVLIAYYARSLDADDPVDQDIPTDVHDVEAWLASDGIDFERDEHLSYDDQDVLRATPSGSIALFKRGELRSVQVPG